MFPPCLEISSILLILNFEKSYAIFNLRGLVLKSDLEIKSYLKHIVIRWSFKRNGKMITTGKAG